jgi:hypothetical protein
VHPCLRATMERQGGLLLRSQLTAAGAAPCRRLVRVRGGVYAERRLVETATAAGAAALRVRAERLVSTVDLVGAGATAALVHDLPLLGAAPTRPVLVERKQDRPGHHGTSRTVLPEEVEQVQGAPVTGLARTVVDVARRSGFLAGVVTADAALRRGVTSQELEAVLRASARWPGRRVAAEVCDFADAGAESPLESVGRVRFVQHGLPTPELQVLLGDACGPFARVDQCWRAQRTVAEADGALKYAGRDSLFVEKQREDRLRDAGWEVVRYTWDEALRTPGLVVSRVLRAFDRSARRAA